MKLIFLGLFLLGICNASPVMPGKLNSDDVGDKIAAIIKDVFDKIISNITDPINIADKNYDLTYGDLVSGHFEVKDFVETGFKGLQASNITVVTTDPAKIYITLGVPSVDINTNYDTDILLNYLIPIYGKGLANINFKNIQLSLTSGYQLTLLPTQTLTLNGLSFQLSVESATFDIHGVIDNEAFSLIVSRILDDTIALFINNHADPISKLLSPVLEQALNRLLAGGNKSALNADLSEKLNQEELQGLIFLYMGYFQNHPRFAELLEF